MSLDISVVVPLYNEEESLRELCTWIGSVMNTHNFTYEVLLIDDGSTDSSWEVVEGLVKDSPNVRGIRFRRNYGKSAALNTGFHTVRGRVVITMDADLQDSPEEIPELHRMITEDKFDLVSGWKKKRYDPITKTIPTKLYNWTTRKMSGIHLHDFNCGLKAYRREVVMAIEVYGEMHRYIPVIAKWAGFKSIGEKVVQHQERKYGVTKFGISRFIRGPLDLLSIIFVSSFGKRPMHFFGGLGSLIFIVGFFLVAYVSLQKLFHILTSQRAPLVTDSPFFYAALVAMVIGTQFFLAGFLGEMISRNAPNRNNYEIDQEIGGESTVV